MATLEFTTDALLGGAVLVDQPSHGYRVNADALLLATFAAERRAALCVDLGAGVGAVALVLYHLGGARRLELVEIDAFAAGLAEQNMARAGASGAVHLVDLGGGLPRALRQRADLVVCNPPFYEPAASRAPRDSRARVARTGSLAPFMRAAAAALRGPRARAAFAYPARSLQALLADAERAGLVAKRLRFVHADAASPARLVLVELRRARPGGLVVEPPLIEWSAPGRRSSELAALMAGRTGDRK